MKKLIEVKNLTFSFPEEKEKALDNISMTINEGEVYGIIEAWIVSATGIPASSGFVPVITREINHVINAQKARAHKIKFSLNRPIESLQTFFPIIIPTFNLLLNKAFDLSLSIEARAFRAKKERTYPPRLKFKIQDYVAIIILISLFVPYFIK